MKKLTTLLLVLAMLALCCAGLAEAVPAMPRVGSVINGFELIEARPYDLIGAEVYRFVHQKTGAELYYTANSDTNRYFLLGFRTQAIDNTGLPHVFEHATLDGSDKYPSKELWFNLANGSYNTYMNAYTDKNLTAYPLGSLSEAQLLKLAEFYVDSCFHPMLMKDESIYREEAWRYRLEAPEDALTIEGTVYSEMLGATTIQRTATHNFLNLVLPGSYCGNDSGGVPEYIPDMTYEDLTRYHERYYHPSNSVSCLYGKFDDYTAFLKLLDDEFSRYDAQDFVIEEPDYAPITGPQEGSYEFPVEAGSDDVDASVILYGTVLPGLKDDTDALLKLNFLASVLGDTNSSLSRAVEKAFPRADFSVGLFLDGPDPVLCATFKNVNPEDAPALTAMVDDAIADIAENGFDPDLLDAIAAGLELSSHLAMEDSSVGGNVNDNLIYGNILTGDPWFIIEQSEEMTNLVEWNNDGTFAALARKWLVGNDLTALAVTRPVPGLKEQNDAALAEKLAEVKAAMSDEEIAALVESTNAEEPENPDTAQMLSELTAVTVASLPEEYRDYPMTDEMGDDGIRRVDVTANVDGIGSVNLLMDLSGLPIEDAAWIKTYANLLGDMDTAEHDYQALDNLKTRYLYGFSAGLTGLAEKGADRPMLNVDWVALDDDLTTSYDLAREILLETSFDDAGRLLELVQSMRTNLKSSITSTPFNALIYRGLGRTLPYYSLLDQVGNLGYYDFLGELEAAIEDDPQPVVDQLNAIRDYFNNSTGLILGYAGSADGIAANRPLADAFAASLDHRDIEPTPYEVPASTEAASEGLIVDSAVQYNGFAMDLDSLGMSEFDARIDVVNALIEDMYLYPQLRDRYGAYGVGLATTSSETGLYAYSYRDPNVAQSFEVFEGLPDFVATLDVDQETVDRYILSVYNGYALPSGELTGAQAQLLNHILGEELAEINLAEMRTVKTVTPETVTEFADLYRAFIDNAYRFTGGGAAAINANAELYENILNPFGAVDKSQQALSDVPEGSEYYEAVRFAYENSLMNAREDGSFGVAEPATQGDLAAALMTVLGESAETPEAFDTLVSYGVMDGESSPEAELTAEDCETVLAYFSEAIGLEYPGGLTAQAEPFTRGDLAATLADYLGWLDSLEAAA